MAQDATVSTRQRKRDIGGAEALAVWERTARQRGRALNDLPRQVVGRVRRRRQGPARPEVRGDVPAVLGRIQATGRATVSRHDILLAALDVLPVHDLTVEQLHAAADDLVARTVAHGDLLTVTAPDVFDVPVPLRRADGTSLYDRPERERWALRNTISEEAWLLQVATEARSRAINSATLSAAIAQNGLGDDQAQAVRELLASDRRVGLLVGPAGAGKTRTLRAVVDAWEATNAPVLGLTVSQAAAEVLASEGQVRAENTAKWLFETRRGRWQLPAGALVLVDEASMVSTSDLVEIIEQARLVDGKVLLVGDPAQLAAIHIGGGFDLLTDRAGASYLHEVRRFAEHWERDASLQLRRRDPAALADYAMRGRIHGGTLGTIERDLFTAWQADALGTDDHGDRQAVLMIVGTNEQAAAMGERARNALIDAGAVDDGAAVRLRDNVASVGDHIVTRRNNRRLVTSSGGWVVNGDIWTVLETHHDGAASVRRHTDGSTITLPADYLAEHTHLGYATTAHRAQGMTVDRCHALVAVDGSHEQLYVSATRGRHGNHLWVAVDSDHQLVREDDDLPDPEQILSTLLARHDHHRLAAHQVIEDSQAEVGSLARLGAVYEDTVRRATVQWLEDLLAARGFADVRHDRQWPALVDRVRQLTLGGFEMDPLISDALDGRPLNDAASVAGVLHWRLGQHLADLPHARPLGPRAATPPGDSMHAALARQAADLMAQRWRDLRSLLAHEPPPRWAAPLGPRPDNHHDRRSWLNAATAVAAYRERYETPDHVAILGERPAGIRPDAQALYDHAQQTVDRHAARQLEPLDDLALEVLDQRQQDILDAQPHFDPAELVAARRELDDATRSRRNAGGPTREDHARRWQHVQRHVDRLERHAEAHRRWRARATIAEATQRQIALARTKRRSRSLRRSAG